MLPATAVPDTVFRLLDELDAACPAGHERRGQRRVPFCQPSWVLWCHGGQVAPARVVTRNLSGRGLGLVTQTPFQRGDQLVLAFAAGGEFRLLCVRVVRVSLLQSGSYSVGTTIIGATREPPEAVRLPLAWLGYRATDLGLCSLA